MAAAARDRARCWEPFGVTEADFAAAPDQDGVRVVNVTPGGGGPGPGQAGWWLRGAAVALGVLAAAAAAVSWDAQYAMVRAVKPVPVVAALEAGIPDVGAVVFAALGVALALHGRRAVRSRALNAACIGISLGMNALAAGRGWRDLAIWVMPAAVYAVASDTLIGVVRAWVLARARHQGEALADDGLTPLAAVAGVVLWLLRLSLAPASTLTGFRSWVITDCPVAPGLRPGRLAEVQAARQDADQRIALAAREHDQALGEAAAAARQAREEATRARAAENGIRDDLARARADAAQLITQALADAARERGEVRAQSGLHAGRLAGLPAPYSHPFRVDVALAPVPDGNLVPRPVHRPRAEPPIRGALPADLVGDYLAERGAADIPMPGGLSRVDWLTRRPVLREPFTAQLGWRNGPAEPLTVVYGPCPRCGGQASALLGQSLPPCLDCASQASGDSGHAQGSPAGPPPGGTPPAAGSGDGQPGRTPAPPPSAAGNGDDDQAQAEASISGRRLREFAHRYLEAGLWPVPAWGARPGGECCCPRGADCPRPGKHPRSVHAGPGPHDYSWKPLACRSHAEVDQRFGPGSRYASGNLMVAIPPGMMAIDRDDDDGGRAAIAELAGELGELPPTLAHRTPHGEHLIYRTPPGWEGRAWVGKDPANPVPAGVDLRMPGQILMAAPSVVPVPGGQARYGPVGPDRIAALPAAYLTAWTPPQPAPRSPSQPMPVPPDGAGRAVRYVHDALTGIAAELASRPPGGRNAAAYTAGLKAGSLLGAARTTPGAEQAAAAWTDEAAEQALIDAAQRNGYVDKDGEAEARRAIRSGLRNGLRRPRALPDFATTRTAPAAQSRPRAAPGFAGPVQRQAPSVLAPRAGRGQELASTSIRQGVEAADQTVSTALPRERQDGRTTAPQHDSLRMRANRAAVAANQAYRAGDLDAARQLTDQAAALDPARADLWQQHHEQITARSLILDAQAARADGDHQRVRHLLGQARELDPRMPAVWGGDLPGLPPAQRALHSRERAAAPGPDSPVSGSRTVAQGTETRHRVRVAAASADRGASRPSWPESPARAEPGVPAPRAAEETAHAQPSLRWDVAGATREPRTRTGLAAGDTQPSAEPADDDPSTRWPAPNPRAARVTSPLSQQGGHVVAASRATRPPERAGTAANAEAGDKTGSERPAVPPPDWRDRLLADARQPWQPGPGQVSDPSLAISPGRQAPRPGIEPDT